MIAIQSVLERERERREGGGFDEVEIGASKESAASRLNVAELWQETEHGNLYLVRYKLVRLAEVLRNKMREGQNKEGKKDEKRERENCSVRACAHVCLRSESRLLRIYSLENVSLNFALQATKSRNRGSVFECKVRKGTSEGGRKGREGKGKNGLFLDPN